MILIEILMTLLGTNDSSEKSEENKNLTLGGPYMPF